MSLRVAFAAPPDIALAVALMGEAFEPRFGEAWSGAQLTGSMAIADTWLQVGWEDDLLAGFSLVRRVLDEAELLLVAVRPSRRGRGHGRTLMAAAAEAARQRGAATMFLEVRDGNAAALALYRALGFSEVGRRTGYYFGAAGERFDAMTFRRSLVMPAALAV